MLNIRVKVFVCGSLWFPVVLGTFPGTDLFLTLMNVSAWIQRFHENDPTSHEGTRQFFSLEATSVQDVAVREMKVAQCGVPKQGYTRGGTLWDMADTTCWA